MCASLHCTAFYCTLSSFTGELMGNWHKTTIPMSRFYRILPAKILTTTTRLTQQCINLQFHALTANPKDSHRLTGLQTNGLSAFRCRRHMEAWTQRFLKSQIYGLILSKTQRFTDSTRVHRLDHQTELQKLTKT